MIDFACSFKLGGGGGGWRGGGGGVGGKVDGGAT
jgi:hypothetical protein